MNCMEIERALQERLDDRRSDLTADLSAHLAVCPACRSFWSSQSALLSAVKSWPVCDPPAGLAEAVLAEWTRSSAVQPTAIAAPANAGPRRKPAARSGWGVLCSMTAIVCLAALLMRVSPPVVTPLASNVAAPVASPESAPVSQAFSGLWEGMRTEYSELSVGSERVWQNWSDLPKPKGLFSEASPADPPSNKRTTDWMRFDRPVSERVGQAFGFLWDALPEEAPHSL